MTPAPPLSRRSLLGLGLVRLVEGSLVAAADRAPDRPLDAEPAGDPAGHRQDGDPEPLLRWLEPAAARLVDAAEVGDGMNVLDVAGWGEVAVAAARRGARVEACDGSAQAVARGRARTAAAGSDVEWTVADAHRLPYPDGSFDRTLSGFGVVHADDPPAAARELMRITRTGGVVAVAAWEPTGLMGAALDLAFDAGGRPETGFSASQWGAEATLHLLLDGTVRSIELTDGSLPMPAGSPAAVAEFLLSAPGPLRAAVDGEADLRALLTRAVDSRFDSNAVPYVVAVTRR